MASTSSSILSKAASLTTARGFSTVVPTAHSAAQKLSAEWKGTSATGGNTKNFINGEFVESKTDKWLEVRDPSTQALLNRVPETTQDEFNEAVAAAEKAFKTWSRTSILTRQRVAMEYVSHLLFPTTPKVDLSTQACKLCSANTRTTWRPASSSSKERRSKMLKETFCEDCKSWSRPAVLLETSWVRSSRSAKTWTRTLVVFLWVSAQGQFFTL